MRRIKQALCLFLAALMLCAPLHAADGSFADVPEKHWAYESIRRAAEYGLVQGVDARHFGLGQKVTRAAYATMLCRLMGWEMISPEQGSFADNQNPEKWYYSAIETAYAHGAIYASEDSCEPTKEINREEMASMTVRALGYAVLAGTVQEKCPFTDVTTNRGYITLAEEMGLVNGTGADRFAPRGDTTREQATAVLLRVYDRLHAELTVHTQEEPPAEAVEAPTITGDTGTVPISPRASVESVYAAALQAGSGGAVTLHTAPLSQTVRGSSLTPGETLTQEQLNTLLENSRTQTYRSSRHESSYLVLEQGSGTTVVWYETEQDLAEKVQLCRLLGVSEVYLVD